jgi:anti-sigma B factor antagonist
MDTMVEKVGDVTIITINIEAMDASNAEDLRMELAAPIKDCRKLVLDLGKCQYVDSRGCGVILSCLRQVSGNGGDLKLCRVAPAVRTVFDLIRLHRLCEIVNTREDAIKAFAS